MGDIFSESEIYTVKLTAREIWHEKVQNINRSFECGDVQVEKEENVFRKRYDS